MRARAAVLIAIVIGAPSGVRSQASFPAARPCLGKEVPRTSISALADCLGDPDPAVRDGIAFEGLRAQLRSGNVDVPTVRALKDRLVGTLAQGGSALQTSFFALALAEVARTDRLEPWMTDAERSAMVDAAARFLSSVTDYRAFAQADGYFHSVAHGADFALQLALNPAVTKPQLDRLLMAIAIQVAPKDPDVAYWAGEPDRLARAVIFIAQRKLHSDAEWSAWFGTVMNPAPLAAWDAAFTSESGIRKHHNVRGFLLSVFVAASTSEDSAIKQLAAPAGDALKLVP